MKIYSVTNGRMMVNERELAFINSKAKTELEEFPVNFIEPGLISYEDCGMGIAYLSPETLEAMSMSIVGKPVVMPENHKDGVTEDDFKEVAVGVVTKVWRDPSGWWWCNFNVWDDQAKDVIRNQKYSVSCAYKVIDVNDAGGTKNNIEYDQEILSGEYTHLALVPNPRYNGAKILLNSIGGGAMKVKVWLKKLLGKEIKNELDPEGSSIDVDGKKISMKDFSEMVLSEMQEIEAKNKLEADKVNKLEESELGEDSEIDIGGKKVVLKDAMQMCRNRIKKNAEAETPEQKLAREKKEKEDKDKTDLERKNADEKAEQDRKDKEKKEADDKLEVERKNSLEAENRRKIEEENNRKLGLKSFSIIKNSAESRNEEPKGAGVTTQEDRFEKGASRYGSGK